MRENRRNFIDNLFSEKVVFSTLIKPSKAGRKEDRRQRFWKDLFRLHDKAVDDQVNLLRNKHQRNLDFYTAQDDQPMIEETRALLEKAFDTVKEEFEHLTVTVIGIEKEDFDNERTNHGVSINEGVELPAYQA